MSCILFEEKWKYSLPFLPFPDTSSWNPFSWMMSPYLFYTIYIIAVDALPTQRAPDGLTLCKHLLEGKL